MTQVQELVRQFITVDTMTLDQAAAEAGTTRWIVYGLVRKGLIPSSRMGRSITVRLTDVEDYLDRLKVRDVNTPA